MHDRIGIGAADLDLDVIGDDAHGGWWITDVARGHRQVDLLEGEVTRDGLAEDLEGCIGQLNLESRAGR